MSEDVLHTSLVEFENIINSRPLTPVTFDHDDLNPLTPNHLLKMKPMPCVAPGLFSSDDCYSKRQWKKVQYLADEFWRRWRREFLPTIIQRQKWTDMKRNLLVGDIVIVVNENLPRGKWEMGRVICTYPARHGIVRYVDLKTQFGILKRPINELCLIKESEVEKLT